MQGGIQGRNASSKGSQNRKQATICTVKLVNIAGGQGVAGSNPVIPTKTSKPGSTGVFGRFRGPTNRVVAAALFEHWAGPEYRQLRVYYEPPDGDDELHTELSCIDFRPLERRAGEPARGS